MGPRFALLCLLLAAVACGSSSTDGSSGASSGGGTPEGGTPVTPDAAESVRQGIVAVIARDPRLADRDKALTHDDYAALALEIGKVPGVAFAQYVGDGLGGIWIEVQNGGVFHWRHVEDDQISHRPALPDNFDFSTLMDPDANADFKPPEVVSGPRASGTYATPFPVASISPDPEFKADDTVSCPDEGKIAIIDFYYKEVKDKDLLYNNEFLIDGQELWDRLAEMGRAAHFTVDVFKNDDINAGNFSRILKDYSYVLVNGHGGAPGPKTAARYHEPLITFVTPEVYDPAKQLEGGMAYAEAWNRGWIIRDAEKNTIKWTPRLIQGVYNAAVPQHWLISTCYSMLPFTAGFAKGTEGWTWSKDLTDPIYNFGDALREKGVKTVFGYVTPAEVGVIARNHLRFFRRTFGGYFSGDRPPSPQTYWPTCMSSQTFFRLKATPQLAVYAPKLDGYSLYTMYTDPAPLYLRATCQNSPANVHAMMQDFMLSAGTPATAFQKCWDSWWGQGKEPTGIQDALCSKGDFPTTTEAVRSAGCNVRYARKVTLAMQPK